MYWNTVPSHHGACGLGYAESFPGPLVYVLENCFGFVLTNQSSHRINMTAIGLNELNSQGKLSQQDDKDIAGSFGHQEILIKAEPSTNQGLHVSAFASDTKVQIMRKFWRLYAFGLAVSLGGMYAGRSD
jgi:hypothetical protein